MYKYLDKLQHSFLDFNQPLGMHMNPENRWVIGTYSEPLQNAEEDSLRPVKSLRRLPRRDFGEVCNGDLITQKSYNMH